MTPIWTTACPDWGERIVAGESLVPCGALFQGEADAAMAVFTKLKIVDAPGQPTFGEALDEDLLDLVRAIFGAYDAATGQRLITQFMLLISKKNGKSTIAAAIMVTALVRNWRHLAELLVVAPSIEVAQNVFVPAAGMIRADPELAELLNVQDYKRTIVHRTTDAMLKIIAADVDVASGTKAGFVLIEELWRFGKNPRAASLLVEVLGGMAARPEGFVLYLTTHSDEAPAGVFKEKLEYFRDVRDGVIVDPAALGVLYEWPEHLIDAEAYLDPTFFHLTNPNLGRSVTQAWLEKELKQAQRGDGESLQLFLAKHLNVEIGMRLRRDRWRGTDAWEAAKDAALAALPERDKLEAMLARCEVAVIGVDGGGDDDLLGVAVIGRERVTGDWLLWAHAFAERSVLDIRKEIAPRLQDFEARGELTLVDEPLQDIEGVADLFDQLRDAKLLPASDAGGFDAAGASMITDELVRRGFGNGERDTAFEIVAVQQGYKLKDAIKTMQKRLGAKILRHCGQELMTWTVSNAKAELKGQSIMITKAAAGWAKIDTLMAAFNAVTLMSRGPEAQGDKASVYESRGLVIV